MSAAILVLILVEVADASSPLLLRNVKILNVDHGVSVTGPRFWIQVK